MRWTQSLIPTMKEDPADAEIPSHRLMLRAGLVRQLMAGAYSYLPLGWRALRKVEQIVREEMERAGAVELHLPAIHPIELYERTGRIDAFGDVLIKLDVPRGDRQVHWALGPTHEEVITDLVGRHISSYKQLPINLYQIQTKFRNEERPRFGVLRTSEFIMKDAYSFSSSLEQLDEAYQQMYDAYCRIYERCGLEYIPVEAESGAIGGDASHEFMVPAGNGEDSVIRCGGCGYAANRERAETGRPAPTSLSIDGDLDAMQQVETPAANSIEQVAQMLGCEPTQMLKTLIYTSDGQPKAVLVRGDHSANDGKVRRALGGDVVELADEATVEKLTGAPVGFAGPVGLKCEIIADHDVAAVRNATAGANAADAHVTGVNLGRDYELSTTFDLRDAEAGDPCPRCDGMLELVHGIEVGHVFKLGTKYSESLDAVFESEEGERHPIIMGCYGLGVNRVIAALAETQHDDRGLIWPMTVAPYEVLVIPLNTKDTDVMQAAEKLYGELREAGIDVLLDDRTARAGVKFNDADLIGIPLRVVIGGRGLKEGALEVKGRTDEAAENVPIEEVVTRVAERVRTEKAALNG